jgi:hypothetical protein
MSKRITIGSNTYNLPLAGENPGWGEELSDIIEALADASNDSVGPDDILETSALISNNISSATNINLFKFNTSTVRSFEAQYYIFRKNDSTTISEAGIIIGNNDDTLGWSISIQKTGEADVVFDIDSTGQVTYTSSDMGGVYDTTNSKIKFAAKALNIS